METKRVYRVSPDGTRIYVDIIRDEDAGVWVATSNDIGLVLEDASLHRLEDRIRIAVPELVEDGHRDISELAGVVTAPDITLDDVRYDRLKKR